MASARELLDKGDLKGAIEAVTQEVKAKPSDATLRATLFELLLFAGEWDRAAKQIDVLAGETPESQMAVMIYKSCLKAERDRAKLFKEALAPVFLTEPPAYVDLHFDAIKRTIEGNVAEARAILDRAEEERPALPGKLGDRAFEDFRDYNDLTGPVLEVYVREQYCWVPLEQVKTLEVLPPKKLRDLFWATAHIESRDGSKGDVMLPCVYAGSSSHPDNAVKLARMTDWKDLGGDVLMGVGAKTWLAGEDEKTTHELTKLIFDEPERS